MDDTNKKFKGIFSAIDIVNNKKKLVILCIGVCVLLIVITATILHNEPIKNDNNNKHSAIEITTENTGMSSWQAQSSEQIAHLTEQISNLSLLVSKEQKLLVDFENKLKLVNNTLSKQGQEINKIKLTNNITKQLIISNPKQIQGVPGLRTYPNLPLPHNPITSSNSLSPTYLNHEVEKHIEISIPPSIPMSNIKRDLPLGILPVGSFFKAVLLNGVEAGTGQDAESNPQPVLMRVVDNAFLPNEYRYRVKSCFVLGSSYGSLSSERVYIRTARISCVGNNGKSVISENIEGYVVDSDGKIGLRGKLISRQGAKLGMAMLAGFSNGIATAFSNAQATSSLSALGVTNTISPTQSMRRATLGGMGGASQELAQFYINQAQNIYPVIDVNNGRIVTVTLSQSIALSWKENISTLPSKFKSKEDNDKPIVTNEKDANQSSELKKMSDELFH